MCRPVWVDASTGVTHKGNICAKLWANGPTHFKNMHVEGPRLGLCVGSDCDGQKGNKGENPNPIYLENSAATGEFHRVTNLVSIGNRFWTDFGEMSDRRHTFIGSGSDSYVYACGDVFVSMYNHQLQTTDNSVNRFAGLVRPYISCSRHHLMETTTFQKGFIQDRIILGSEINVYPSGDSERDTQAFEHAISLAQTGGRIIVNYGNYQIKRTLYLSEREMLIGQEGANIELVGSDYISLFKVKATFRVVKGIVIRGLNLSSASTVGTIAIDLNDITNFPNKIIRGLGGAAGDLQFQDLKIQGFETGIYSGYADLVIDQFTKHPMYDSISVKDVHFIGNNIAANISSQNGSNWNFEDIKVDLGKDQTGVILNGIGLVSLRKIRCTGTDLAEACLNITRQTATFVDDLRATNVKNAIKVSWENGWTQFPVVIRNSDLTAGVFFQGKIFLTSIKNKYPSIADDTSQLHVVKFGDLYDGSTLNNAPGRLSKIVTCDDSFINAATGEITSEWSYQGILNAREVKCQ